MILAHYRAFQIKGGPRTETELRSQTANHDETMIITRFPKEIYDSKNRAVPVASATFGFWVITTIDGWILDDITAL
jgi:hypothetical protein